MPKTPDKPRKKTLPQLPVAVITGGAQGIGRAIAETLLAGGHAIVIADHDREACAEAATAHRGDERVLVMPTDVADEGDVRLLMRKTLHRFQRIDALINNAGIADPHGGMVEHLSLKAWNRMLAVDLTGPFLCVKHAVPALRKARGVIVNIASTRALQSEAHSESYAAAKGGLVALTHALAISLGPHIRTVAVSPGWIAAEAWKKAAARRQPKLTPTDHDQHPVGRVGRPEDIADLVAFLVSARAGFITGQNIVVDGGMTKKMIYAE